MLRKIVAVIVGFVLAFLVMTVLFTQPVGFKGLWCRLFVYHYLPALCGGFISGYLARQRGWVCGLIVGVLLETLGIITMSFIFWIIYQTPYIVQMMMSAIRDVWTMSWWVALGVMISGMISGYLGQYLAQIWHKRPQQKR